MTKAEVNHLRGKLLIADGLIKQIRQLEHCINEAHHLLEGHYNFRNGGSYNFVSELCQVLTDTEIESLKPQIHFLIREVTKIYQQRKAELEAELANLSLESDDD